MDGPRRALGDALGLTVLVVALVAATRQPPGRPVHGRLVAETLAKYEAIEPVIPARARVGLIQNSPPFGGGAVSAHFLAQFAFAPRVVDLDVAGVTVVVSEPGAGPDLDHDPRLAAFDLVTVGDGGVRLYQRRP